LRVACVRVCAVCSVPSLVLLLCRLAAALHGRPAWLHARVCTHTHTHTKHATKPQPL
jgi:hypothetical protein